MITSPSRGWRNKTSRTAAGLDGETEGSDNREAASRSPARQWEQESRCVAGSGGARLLVRIGSDIAP